MSMRASVRSRWLMTAVSAGGKEGREAGLSDSWGGQGAIRIRRGWEQNPRRGLPSRA